ncbi:homeobox-domain-containing protein [Cylindrobasidium torrendii FP15055 ss-10]|uniref:Homeobox-domain-containing protein n=1 Tax=Cylindrobasidium torrendii FP15055 ss-10 TaxID=1314674 RepID=A0A0D7BIB0_9AGAR|nr:homeobox-domain-containing protein [Cylindrobasidium torrendii FP15055 ss-10]
MPPVASADRPKKPRNRHSPQQLAALNELYERDEHPALEARTSLAEKLGMETKTVNSWFQNKRASTKKRSMTVKPTAHEVGRVVVPRPSNSASSSSTPRPSESGDHADLDDIQRLVPRILPEDVPPRASHPSLDLDRTVYSDVGVARRVRPPPRASSEYPDEYSSKRPVLDAGSGIRTAGAMPADLRYHTSIKQTEEDVNIPEEPRAYVPLPPASRHPSLALPPASNHPSLQPRTISSTSASLSSASQRRSPSVVSTTDEPSSSTTRRSHHARRGETPYNLAARLRRSRPEPQQLDALRELFMKNPTPTIEQRSALALDIGMDLGKVTNWFRNLRQTSRRRAKKAEDDDDEYGYPYPHRTSSGSRSPSPSVDSLMEDAMMMDDDEMHGDGFSDDDMQEAVTPSPPASPAPAKEPTRSRFDLNSLSALALDYAEGEKAAMKFSSGIKFEDALLLVSFSQQYVH